MAESFLWISGIKGCKYIQTSPTDKICSKVYMKHYFESDSLSGHV